MTTEDEQEDPRTPQAIRQGGGSDAVYAIGIFGAWVYYFKRATTTQERVIAFFKGLAWPAFLVYDALRFLEKAVPPQPGDENKV